MPCTKPVPAWQLADGSMTFIERGPIVKRYEVPCNQCMGCRLERTRQWAVRCVHEAQTSPGGMPNNEFVTLTYDDDHYDDPRLNYRDFQLFMKRLRHEVRVPIRFFMCGEYGDKTRRKHFHALIFGYRFPDRKHYKNSPGSKEPIYESAQLSKLWPYGNAFTGSVNYKSAQYVASYITKKINGDLAEAHYSFIHPNTGELWQLTPEFAHMSLKPGIGAKWYELYGRRVRIFDNVIVNGRESSIPKYYDRLAKRHVVAETGSYAEAKNSLDETKAQREYKALTSPNHALNNSPERDAVREEVMMARRNFYKIRKGEL